jgi:hypothetical protein
MLTKTSKTARRLVLVLLSAIALTSVYLASIQGAKAGNEEPPRQFKTDKVSPLLKAQAYAADQRVTVIVTLNGPKSAALNSLLRRAGVRQRREMKNLGTFSLSLRGPRRN